MQSFFLITLFIFWMLFWSFSSVLIYRLQSGEKGILNGRSHCAKCNHTLGTFDLIPVFSWLINKARCKYCKDKISSIYPILEISTWILFSLVWYFLIDFSLIIEGNISEIIKLIFWLSIAFISIIYTFYDILFLEIHEWVMLSWVWLSILRIIMQSFWIIDINHTLNISLDSSLLSINHSIWLLILSVFWLYKIMLNEYSLKKDFLILALIWIWIYLFNIWFTNGLALLEFPAISALIWAYCIFLFFFIQIAISGWKVMWGWDLRIAIFIWLLLWASLSFAWTFITYMVWSIIWIWLLLWSKIKNKNKKFNSEIPFWPFLAIWFFITIFYQKDILELLKIYF